MDLGFTVSSQTQTMIAVVFVLYSLVIVALGLFVKWSTRRDSAAQRVAGFLTGGGNLGALAVGLIMVTNIMSSGGMVGGPGLSYGTGFIWSLCVFCSFINIFLSLGSVGKKMAIMAHRTSAQTVLALFRHRYQSRLFSTILGCVFIIFLLPYSASQFIGGGRLFTVVMGGGDFRVGVLLFAVITLVYTLSGGVKSLSKIAVVQGCIMIFSVIAISIATYGAVNEKFGSLQKGMEWVSANQAKLVDAWTWPPAIFIGTALIQSICLIPLPHALMGTFTYNKSANMKRAIVVGIVGYTIIQFSMSGVGPIAFAYNPNVSGGDYVIPMLLSTLLPPWLGGVVIAGAVAAIQSTVAAFFIIIASTIVKDIYRSWFKPDMSMEVEQKKINIWTVITAVIAIVMAFVPNQFLQTLVNFAIGGLAAGFFFPLFLGLYWKKATPVAAIAGTLSGTLVYILATVFKELRFGQHQIVIALLVSAFMMVALSFVTAKVPKGVFQVWFAETYDEEYAKRLV